MTEFVSRLLRCLCQRQTGWCLAAVSGHQESAAQLGRWSHLLLFVYGLNLPPLVTSVISLSCFCLGISASGTLRLFQVMKTSVRSPFEVSPQNGSKRRLLKPQPKTNHHRRGIMKKFVVVLVLLVVSAAVAYPVSAQSNGSCTCMCVNGEVEPVCHSSIDMPTVCAPRVCSIVPPSVQPIDPPTVPPVGTNECKSEQVYNENTGQYEWKEICR
jgi:hypothetical protein